MISYVAHNSVLQYLHEVVGHCRCSHALVTILPCHDRQLVLCQRTVETGLGAGELLSDVDGNESLDSAA